MNAAVEVCHLPNIPIGGGSDPALDGLVVTSSNRRRLVGFGQRFDALRGGQFLPNSKVVRGDNGLDLRHSASTGTLTESEFESNLKTKAPKRVGFVTDHKGRVYKETFKYQQQRTKHEVKDCWYTQEQFKQFRADCKKEAISQKKTSYQENFAAVYEACKKGSFKSVTKERAYVSAASCRGLEAIVYQPLQADRKNLLVTVLKTQRSLPKAMAEEKREEAIASASRFLSKQARQLARVLGSGDAAVVMANDRLAVSKQKRIPQAFSS